MSDELLREFVKHVLGERVDAACTYEKLVIKTLKQAEVAGMIKRAACSDATRPDADILIGDNVYYVEVKANSRARMGTGSVGYSDGQFFPTGKNKEWSTQLADMLNSTGDRSLTTGIDKLVKFLASRSPTPLKSKGFPLSGFTPEAWYAAANAGVLRLVNRTIVSDMSVITSHYAQKNVHYIQIGGLGFFRLGEANPANLPVPVLDGKVHVELVASKAGDEFGRSTSKAGLRAQARLMTTTRSPYTLDSVRSVEKLIDDTEAMSA